jgi:hypothetical protein
LDKFKDCPNEVANFMKEILRSLEQPVCPFEKYPEFRDLPKLMSPQKKLESIVTLLRDLPDINRVTLLYLARFFNEVSTYQDKNKMTAYNLAVIITPNLFRSRELTSKDLLNHGTLTDIFTLIMGNVDKIIEMIRSAEDNFDLHCNQVMNDDDNDLQGSKRNQINNRNSTMDLSVPPKLIETKP